MNAQQKRTVQRDRRAAGWLTAHPTLTAVPIVAQLLALLFAVLDELNDAAVGQESHLRAALGATAEAKSLRDTLISDHLRVITSLAEIAIPDVAKVTASLRMPDTRIDTEGLLTSAEGLAVSVEEHQDALQKAGLAADAAPRMRAVVQQYRKAIDSRGQFMALRSGATEGVDVQIKEARKLVKSLSAQVKLALRSDPRALAEWKQLVRIGRKGVQGTTPAAEPDVSASPVDAPLPKAIGPTAVTTQGTEEPTKTA
jgi:hypothetical protein